MLASRWRLISIYNQLLTPTYAVCSGFITFCLRTQFTPNMSRMKNKTVHADKIHLKNLLMLLDTKWDSNTQEEPYFHSWCMLAFSGQTKILKLDEIRILNLLVLLESLQTLIQKGVKKTLIQPEGERTAVFVKRGDFTYRWSLWRCGRSPGCCRWRWTGCWGGPG